MCVMVLCGNLRDIHISYGKTCLCTLHQYKSYIRPLSLSLGKT